MTIQDRHFHYPVGLEHDAVLARVQSVLARSANASLLADPRLGLAAAIWRWCLEYDMGPAWPLISLQRERGLLGHPASDIHDWLYAEGYVGQDGPGTVNHRWDGLVPQLWLNIHQTAWLGGHGSPDAYGVFANIHPGAGRWDASHPSPIQLYTTPGVKGAWHTPKSEAEHCVLSYTPHAESMDLASRLLEQFGPEFQ